MTHSITPPQELVREWFHDAQSNGNPDVVCWMQATAVKAAQWGADQELEACCGLLVQQGFDLVDYLRAARRLKPPSLKEQALEALKSLQQRTTDPSIIEPLSRALEELP